MQKVGDDPAVDNWKEPPETRHAGHRPASRLGADALRKRFCDSVCPILQLTTDAVVPMRLKSLALASIVPVVLAAAPGIASAQRVFVRCRDDSSCIRDRDIADRARERAFRARDEAREELRSRLRSAARLRQLDAADRARENAFRARIRADERRDRARELRDDRRYDRPGRYRVRW